MAHSDDEEDVMPEAVAEYHFVDDKEEPICFSLLPILWSEGESPDGQKGQVFLHGKTDDGLQKIFKQVVAWKVELEDGSAVVRVLSKDKKWLKLLKPRKAYEDIIRKVLVTLECLWYLKRNPESTSKSLWEHVQKEFSHFGISASEDDLSDHLTLIQSMAKRDDTLSKSQLLLKFLSDLPRKKVSNKKVQKPDFINDGDDEEADNNDGDESEEDEVECFDTVCAICDNGGELLCCEGQCLRSFHATKDTGIDSDCKTLGFTRAQVRAIQNFLCPNCVNKKHQCFSCGKLGNSNKESGAEVFRCISANCGHFYHPHCVAKLLHRENEAEAAVLEKNISSGESFLCPVHKCVVCGQFEEKGVKELQFAMCRRCPKSYHRKCLPKSIAFEDSEDEDIEQRAWDGLIPNRILIYCLKHKIDEDLGTPVRNHIIFPGILENKAAPPTDSGRVKVLAKRKAEDLSRGKSFEKLKRTAERVPSVIEASDNALSGSALRAVKKLKTSDISKNDIKDSTKKGSLLDRKKLSPMDELGPLKTVKKDMLTTKVGELSPSSGKILVDDETKKRIMLLVKKSPSSSLTVEDLLKKKRLPSIYSHSSRHVGKTITQGKVEGSIEAVRAALQKFEKGCGVADAKAVCGPDILNQIVSWKKKFRVYLSPFLHGVRYSSYGRHFTKVDKLEEIVGRLHWYVQDDDMIVDFCCGANDFSLLMKKKLEATGKKCLFKNYDLFQPKNDFNFEKRDWMTVQPKELPAGSQLIMGLNPPFGVNAALANKFIDKALEFKPKLLILIVPKETERLDEKSAAYDLIWEDEEKLAGKSFYLPGSVDVNDNQIEQWNVKPPALYLWSRPDWTARHKAIALKHGHRSSGCKEPHLEAGKEPPTSAHQIEDHNNNRVHTGLLSDLPKVQNDRAVVYGERGPSPDVLSDKSKLESNVDRKYERKPVENTGKEKSERKVKKKARKRKAKKKDEISGKGTTDNTSDMSISPSRPTDPQQVTNPDHKLDASLDGTTGLAGLNRPAQGFDIAYRGEWDSSLPRDDIENLERKYTADRVTGLERRFTGEDIDSLEIKYAAPSWSRSFSGSPYDLPNDSTGRLNYEGLYGSNDRSSGYMRNSPLPPFEPGVYTGEESRLRTDIGSSLRLYGQQEPNDARRSWRTETGTPLPSAQASPFSSSFGLSGSAVGASAMNRYAPRLDELNYVRGGNSMPNMSRQPGDSSVFGMMTSARSSFTDAQSMFPGRRSSGGWLDE